MVIPVKLVRLAVGITIICVTIEAERWWCQERVVVVGVTVICVAIKVGGGGAI